MKSFLIAAFSLWATISFSQTIKYPEWKKEAKTNIRLLPKYGHQAKTDKQKAADQELIDNYIAQEGTRRKASEVLIEIGFEYLNRGEIKTAMYRFNQAWLLDPNNEDVFWGWGSVYFHFNDYQKALEQYNEGLLLNPTNPRLLTDKATIYMGNYYDKNDSGAIKTAINLFSESYAIDSTNQNTTYKLAVAYYNIKDCDNAWKFYEICSKLGGNPIKPTFTKALEANCKR
ncbi:tetratricopeptide repeat protein [Dyadobacter sp. CY312]|uniref:tetratricopeptide repeat protein n=1 Tax=Dyadobacter sp. CY312 TaxID=2907303 RepID=UPI001F3B0AA9|nr:hypothetical protein [Dyadobacter sp. CY312]MCE7041879.1 hypothetical protein [Dyadobacter sp. CY312]